MYTYMPLISPPVWTFFSCLSCMFMSKNIIYLLCQEEAYSNAFFYHVSNWIWESWMSQNPPKVLHLQELCHISKEVQSPSWKLWTSFFENLLISFLTWIPTHLGLGLNPSVWILWLQHSHIDQILLGLMLKCTYFNRWDIKVLTGGMSQFHC